MKKKTYTYRGHQISATEHAYQQWRDLYRPRFVQFLKKSEHHFQHGELGGVALGEAYTKFKQGLSKYKAFYDDSAYHPFHINAVEYFRDLYTGRDIADFVKDEIVYNNADTDEMVHILTVCRHITNFDYLYLVDISSTGSLLSIKRASTKMVVKRLQKLIQNTSSSDAEKRVEHILYLMNVASTVSADITGATSLMTVDDNVGQAGQQMFIREVNDSVGLLKGLLDKKLLKLVNKYLAQFEQLFVKSAQSSPDADVKLTKAQSDEFQRLTTAINREDTRIRDELTKRIVNGELESGDKK